MQKYKQKLIIWLLKQLGIEESHIRVVVGELTMQEAKHRESISNMSRYIDLLNKEYGEWTPLPVERRDQTNGFVYFITDGDRGTVKIGFSTDPKSRMASLQTSTPSKLELLATIEGDMQTERQLHQRFAEYRVSGEWFRLADDLVEFIESIK